MIKNLVTSQEDMLNVFTSSWDSFFISRFFSEMERYLSFYNRTGNIRPTIYFWLQEKDKWLNRLNPDASEVHKRIFLALSDTHTKLMGMWNKDQPSR